MTHRGLPKSVDNQIIMMWQTAECSMHFEAAISLSPPLRPCNTAKCSETNCRDGQPKALQSMLAHFVAVKEFLMLKCR